MENYSIGELAKKTNTSIRTLHYYDEISLLKADKCSNSGHRLYTEDDIRKLQKIVVFKFLGYSLREIKELMNESTFDFNLNRTLYYQKKALEEKKAQISTALKAINRTVKLLEEVGEVDSEVLMSLIHSIQTEKEQQLWLEQFAPKEAIEHLFDKPEAEMLAFDKEFIELSKKVKRLKNRPVDDSEVQAMVAKNMETNLAYVGEGKIAAISEIDLDNMDVEAVKNMTTSPFTREEEEWLQQAIGYYMTKHHFDSRR
ncbi:MerR family transcriptional regulator [Virgibacillus pantothenticus]|uniref:MerR family transcriptional regulator n=1 Tax=Virgibacillus pantothenticus TaxID=1473 RepID=UPI001B10661E|nr:MerR family transcriptional regulator [Virgibacillus pantothenticus]MBU8565737.1 MerR family transcriptional regulator [Virgibacillus pantothenticus]MBU8599676.1 MerR family transcriptional regulator [Virgibacillus pantothenticus]MBU8634123.1 MerR family transcriptional regulator [Virgibacillus pantothenticus]MBU8642164.1 MerR family transcriptional regulator [Virgibacillus pantothenticus]MBU8645853.1 MerR family transcriptional regulator [Virgibacillus pantothenticus]